MGKSYCKITVILIFFILLSQISFGGDVAARRLLLKLKDAPNSLGKKGVSINISEDESFLAIKKKFKLQNFRSLKNSISRSGVSKSSKPFNFMDKLFVIDFGDSTNVMELISQYMATGLFEYVEPDYRGRGAGVAISPNDAGWLKQWDKERLGMPTVWDITTGDTSLILAVLDAGINLNHADFMGRMVYPMDFVEEDTIPQDENGHGANVTSIAASTGNNGEGFAGMDWKCKIMPIRVADADDRAWYSDYVRGIEYAVDNGARVISMSQGGTSQSQALQDAADYAQENGVLIVACMFNDNQELVYYPAAYDNVLAVGATSQNDERAMPFLNPNGAAGLPGSNFGSHIDVCAPGNYVSGVAPNSDNLTWIYSGTSQATPQVAGLAMLMLSQNPNLTGDELKSIMEQTATDKVGRPEEDAEGWDKYHGWGLINPMAAIGRVTPTNVFTKKEGAFVFNMLNQTLKWNSDGSAVIRIFSLDGKQLRKLKLEPYKKYIDLDLRPGRYILDVIYP